MESDQPAPAGLWPQLRRKGAAHWLTVAVLTVLGTLAGHWISEKQIWVDVRYRIYQRTFDLTHPHGPLYPKRTALVLVSDEEYWKGELAGRAPIKRDYLAKLVRKLDAAEPALIALDFDLRSPTTDGSLLDHPDYVQETRQLGEAVREVGGRRSVVLPAIVGFDAQGNYVEQPTVLDGFDFGAAQVRRGYIQLPYDMRRIPVSLELGNGRTLDSFAGAIVAAADPTAYSRLEQQSKDALPFGSYMNEAAFSTAAGEEDKKLFTAGEVLGADAARLRRQLGHKIVIVSGAWSLNGYHSGSRVDLHPTPAGLLPGDYVHANYVEALLNERTYKPVSETLVIALEVLLVLGVAVVLVLEVSPWAKSVIVVGLTLFFAALTYFLIQNLGLFCDFFVPVVVLGGHLVVEKVVQWRSHARYNSPGPPTAPVVTEVEA